MPKLNYHNSAQNSENLPVNSIIGVSTVADISSSVIENQQALMLPTDEARASSTSSTAESNITHAICATLESTVSLSCKSYRGKDDIIGQEGIFDEDSCSSVSLDRTNTVKCTIKSLFLMTITRDSSSTHHHHNSDSAINLPRDSTETRYSRTEQWLDKIVVEHTLNPPKRIKENN